MSDDLPVIEIAGHNLTTVNLLLQHHRKLMGLSDRLSVLDSEGLWHELGANHEWELDTIGDGTLKWSRVVSNEHVRLDDTHRVTKRREVIEHHIMPLPRVRRLCFVGPLSEPDDED